MSKYQERWPNGNIRETGKFLNGKPFGIFQGFHPCGKIWYETNYGSNGIPRGIWKMWDTKGNLVETETWEKGRLKSFWQTSPPWEWPEEY